MNLGFPEMIFIFLAALVIFGPKKLPEIGRQVGRAMAEFKRASNEFKSQLENEMRQIELEENRKRYEAGTESPANSIAAVASAATAETLPMQEPPVVLTDADVPAAEAEAHVVITDSEAPVVQLPVEPAKGPDV